MITFNNVSKVFRLSNGVTVTAVEDLNLNVKPGEIFGCIGPNGAGKSTTIKMLLNLIVPDNGTITVNSLSSAQVESRRSVGYLPENMYLYDFLTAEEYLRYAGELSGMKRKDIAERSCVLLAKLKLESASKRRIVTYSKGMQQRTAIAAALIHNPDLVILDEPMSGLDPLGRKLIFDLILDLKKNGKTVFISSHVMTDIERLCDRIGIIVQGKLSYLENVSDLSSSLEDIFLEVVNKSGLIEVK